MSAYIPVELQRQIRSHFRNCCAYCRTAEELTVAIFEFEHIIPRSVGGETIFDNLCLSCPTCNRYKSTLQTALDPTTKQMVPLFHPHLQVWEEHFSWSEDAIELAGLTPIGSATIVALKMNRPQLIRVRRMWVKLGEHPPKFE